MSRRADKAPSKSKKVEEKSVKMTVSYLDYEKHVSQGYYHISCELGLRNMRL